MKDLHTPLAGSLLALTLFAAVAAGCSSPKTQQDVCDCLNKQADAYLAKHPDLTKAQLEADGNAVMTELLTPCKDLSDDVEQQLKQADPAASTQAHEQVQQCLNALAERMKKAAKDDAATKAVTDAADDQAADMEAAADRLVADIEAGKATPESSASDAAEAPAGGSVSDSDYNKMLATYSDYVNQYASLIRKAAKGDMSAMSESAGIMAKSQELEQQLKENAGKATPAQQARFAKVQAQAMSTMMQVQK